MKRWVFVAVMAVVFLYVGSASAFHINTKPISGLRDYNGTYTGTPGTGSINYVNGTLWRDNQDGGAVSLCNGEGCGKHAGVDIPVASGTNVYSVSDGTVFYSACNGAGWGGLIIIQTTSPYTGETVYVSYAHLRERLVSSGSISEGTLIGRSGGGSGDLCPGNSTGSHLHFQIDKNHGASKPWGPSSVNQPDSNFEVTQYTYNPVIF